MKRIVWTREMEDALRRMRADGAPLFLCAEVIGVSYQTAVRKARSLDLAQRLNRGRLSGLHAFVASAGTGAQHTPAEAYLKSKFRSKRP